MEFQQVYIMVFGFGTFLPCFVATGLTLAPLVVKVDPNLNVILTACLTVYVGCYRSVKPTPPSVSWISIVFPADKICVLRNLFLIFLGHVIKYFRRQCPTNMPCGFHWLGVLCCCRFSYFSNFYQRTWLMLF